MPAIMLLLVFSPAYGSARDLNSIDLINRAYKTGQINQQEALNYKIDAILRPESLPSIYRSRGIIKSATTILMEARQNRHLLSSENSRILAKGRSATLTDLYGTGITLQSYASPQGRFRIHYTTDNSGGDAVPANDTDADGVPDYVERFADILDHVWTTEIEVMGYDAPPSDGTEGGDCLLDVYLADIDAYGYTQIDEGDTAARVYMIFENDFALYFPPNTDPDGDIPGDMKAVAAHEFFHTVQFQISDDICTNGWWMEASATWMEDHVYPDVNDYINYIYYWFQHPYLPLDTYSGSGCAGDPSQSLYAYGTAIWIKHLTEKYGSEFVYDVWNRMKNSGPAVNALSAVISALNDRGVTLEEELGELRVANATMTYEDALWYKSWQTVNPDPNLGKIEVYYEDDIPGFSASKAYTGVSLPKLASKYYSFSAPHGSGNLSIDFNGGSDVGVMVTGFNADKTAYDITEIVTDTNNAGSVTVNGFGAGGPYENVVVIPINHSFTTQEDFNLTVSYTAAYNGDIISIDIKPSTSTVVTGDNGINGKQQYRLIMKDDNGKYVLKSGTAWGSDPPDIIINASGLAVLTNTVTGGTISASLPALTPPGYATLSAVSPAIAAAGKPRGCRVSGDSRCFIATAAFGTSIHPYVGILRDFRDAYLLTNKPGRWFVSSYYQISPPIAEIISGNPALKVIVKILLIPAIIISWVMLKLSSGEMIIIAFLMIISGLKAGTLLKNYVP
ncbi:MAG: hypothetical protein IT393_02470 [Nitrospirae bacterium]|nr:hypothetical protein [Nitrospirota bacterium]